MEKKQRKIQLGVLKDAAEHLKSGGRYKTSGIGGSPRRHQYKIKTDNSDANQHNEKICWTHL